MQLFEVPKTAVIGFFIMVSVFAARKITYQLYSWFPNVGRVYQFIRQREFKFYWRRRADFSVVQLLRLYVLRIVTRLDECLPVIDCERQAAKAQNFHDSLVNSKIRGWHYRYINPKAWPVLLFRRCKTVLLAFFLPQKNKVVNKLEARTARNRP